MAPMGVEHGQQGWAFKHDADAGVRASVDAPAVVLGALEGPFQVQVVAGQVLRADEQAGAEAVHDLAHVLAHWIGIAAQVRAQGLEPFLAKRRGTVAGVQTGLDLGERGSMVAHCAKVVLGNRHAAVDALGEPSEQPVLGHGHAGVEQPPEGLPDLAESMCHAHAGRFQGTALVVVENAAHCRAEGEDDGTGRRWLCGIGVGSGRRAVGRSGGRRSGVGRSGGGRSGDGGRRCVDAGHGALDLAQPTDPATHADLGMAVQLQHGLGGVAQEVVGAVAAGHPGEHLGDAGDEGVLLVGDPSAHGQAEPSRPVPGEHEQAGHLRGGA